MSKGDIETYYENGQWKNRAQGNSRASNVHDTKADAQATGRETASSPAFPAQSSSLGVVYTPVPVVDFILRAADQVCRDQFGYGITDPGVHVQDPFNMCNLGVSRDMELAA